MYKSILLFLITIISISLSAGIPEPSDSGLRGKVIDGSTSKGLEYATVMVYNQADSSFVEGTITGPDGAFDIKLKPGTYYVKVQFVAYGTITVSDVQLQRPTQLRDLGSLFIVPDDKLLSEVEVVAERSTVEMSLDKRVFNIGRDISSKASNAVEVLENIPSVTVDIEGNVSLRGDEGVRILIDGKMSGMAGVSNRNALRAISADMIERIEVITNPSVRYEAEGSSGIINIVLKKDRRKGYNGSIDLNAGYPLQLGLGINANYRLNKMNLFASYNIGHNENRGGGTVYREIFSSGLISEQESERTRRSFNNTLRFGAEYAFDPKTSLSGNILYRHSRGNNPSTVTYNDFTDGNLFATTRRSETQEEIDPTLEYALDFRRQFNRKDQLLTASVRYTDNAEEENSTILEKVLFRTLLPYPDDLLQRMLTKQTNNNFQAQADYIRPLREKEKLETGLRYQNRSVTNDYKVEQRDDTGNYTELPEFSNIFEYNEDIFAAYLLYGAEKGKFNFQLGTRTEWSKISTKLLETGEENNRSYLDFFPSAHFTYKLNQNNNLQLSYSRRIRRPGFWQLNPFRNITDNRFIMSGNPALKPVYTNAYEIGYLRFFKQGNVNFNTYYRQSNDVFMRVERVDSTGITYARPENFAGRDDIGIEIIGMANPYKWLNLSGSLNFFRSVTEGELYGKNYHVEDYSWTGRIMARTNLRKGLDAQMALNYRGKSKTPQGNRLPDFGADAGISKDVLKNKGTVTLNVRDIFGTRKWALETLEDNFYSKTQFQWSRTSVTVNFNYRINQQKRRAPERRMENEDGMMEF
ncbi:MAG TPA: TonB-dependent receptor [Bacteroidales bacterium]|nr:TonB-dependent receptor [Bacteroidales bacterium]